MRNDEDMSCNVNPLRRILRRSWKLPELLRLDELCRVAVVHPAARGRRCIVKGRKWMDSGTPLITLDCLNASMSLYGGYPRPVSWEKFMQNQQKEGAR